MTNWAGPETVSMRDYCHHLGEMCGRQVTFDEVPGFIRSRAVDTSKQRNLIGDTAIGWRDGLARLVADRR